MVALIDSLVVAKKAETVAVRTPVRESRCNGKVERAVRSWQGQVAAMKDHVETLIKKEISADITIFTQLVVHDAETLN